MWVNWAGIHYYLKDCFPKSVTPLLAPHKEVHRSKCLTKNYCSKSCWKADVAVHKVCCNPEKELRQIEERKLKIGGMQKIVASNAAMASLAEQMGSVTQLVAKNVRK